MTSKIQEGERNKSLCILANSMVKFDVSESTIMMALREANANICEVPLPSEELNRILSTAIRYKGESVGGR